VTVLPLILNISLLVTLSVTQQFIVRRWREDSVWRQLAAGSLYGAVTVVGMMTPFTLAPGIIFDGRSIILGIAGLFGGPVVAGTAALIAAAYRIYLGGAGALMGVLVIAESALLGLIFRGLARRQPSLMRIPALLGLGVAIHVVMILLISTLPGGYGEEAVKTIALPVLVLYPIGFVIVSQLMLDQQHRLAAEDALKESEKRYRAIIHSAPFGMYVYHLEDGELRFVTANPAADRIVGSEHERLLGTRIQDAFPLLDRDGIPGLYTRLAREGGTWRTEAYPYDDGKVRGTFEVTAFNAGRDTVAVAFTDVSERISADEELVRYREQLETLVAERTTELEQANARLAEANEAKTRFLRAMSHELRTPLNSIIGFTDLLTRGMAGELNEEQNRQIGMVNSSGRHLLALINDVLDLSRIEAHRLELHTSGFDAVEPAREVVQAMVPEAETKGLALELIEPEGPLALESDRLKVRQILLNLVGNAVKFTQSGTVTVTVTPSGSGLVTYTIADTGPGIPRARQEAVFGEFVQGDESEGPSEGTGLGLAISRGLAHALGGVLRLNSTPGRGSTFTVTLPRRPLWTGDEKETETSA